MCGPKSQERAEEVLPAPKLYITALYRQLIVSSRQWRSDLAMLHSHSQSSDIRNQVAAAVPAVRAEAQVEVSHPPLKGDGLSVALMPPET